MYLLRQIAVRRCALDKLLLQFCHLLELLVSSRCRRWCRWSSSSSGCRSEVLDALVALHKALHVVADGGLMLGKLLAQRGNLAALLRELGRRGIRSASVRRGRRQGLALVGARVERLLQRAGLVLDGHHRGVNARCPRPRRYVSGAVQHGGGSGRPNLPARPPRPVQRLRHAAASAAPRTGPAAPSAPGRSVRGANESRRDRTQTPAIT